MVCSLSLSICQMYSTVQYYTKNVLPVLQYTTLPVQQYTSFQSCSTLPTSPSVIFQPPLKNTFRQSQYPVPVTSPTVYFLSVLYSVRPNTWPQCVTNGISSQCKLIKPIKYNPVATVYIFDRVWLHMFSLNFQKCLCKGRTRVLMLSIILISQTYLVFKN